MTRGLATDLADAGDAVESILAKLPKMDLAEKVDAAARLNSVRKSIEEFDETVKAEIKDKLQHKDGNVLGRLFKAVLTLVPTDRFNQKKFKENNAALFDEYVETNDVERVTFELR